MQLDVDLQSGKPVYRQLIDQVKVAVAMGRLQPGDRLPSIREVAVQTRVNRNTVARAYSDLETEGVIVTRQGQGAFVSDGASPLSSREQRRRLQEPLDQFLTQARLFGFSEQTIRGLFEERLGKMMGDEQ